MPKETQMLSAIETGNIAEVLDLLRVEPKLACATGAVISETWGIMEWTYHPLDVAIKEKKQEIALLLLDFLESLGSSKCQEEINKTNEITITSLYFAIANDLLEVVRKLLILGADRNDDPHGDVMLHAAFNFRHFDVMELLLESPCPCDLGKGKKTTKEDMGILIDAGRANMILLLIERESDLTKKANLRSFLAELLPEATASLPKGAWSRRVAAIDFMQFEYNKSRGLPDRLQVADKAGASDTAGREVTPFMEAEDAAAKAAEQAVKAVEFAAMMTKISASVLKSLNEIDLKYKPKPKERGSYKVFPSSLSFSSTLTVGLVMGVGLAIGAYNYFNAQKPDDLSPY